MKFSRTLAAAGASAVLACGAVLVFLSRPAAGAAEAGALFVSGMQIGAGNRALLRLTNVSPNRGDLYDVRISVFEPTAGRQINSPTDNLFSLFVDDSHEFDIGAIVQQHQASLGDAGNTRYRGPVEVIVSGSAGAVNPFGPDTISATAVQTERRATYATHLRWIAR